jgi:hypothetical protein
VRVVGLGQNVNGWRQKEFDQRRGAFVTTTFDPFRNTRIRVEAEAFNRALNAPDQQPAGPVVRVGWEDHVFDASRAGHRHGRLS